MSGSKVFADQAPLEDDGVDVTLIKWMLSLTASERLAVLQGFVDSCVELSVEDSASLP